MTPRELERLARTLEILAHDVMQIRGVDRRNPHAFLEDKSELRERLIIEAIAVRNRSGGAVARRPVSKS